MNPLSRIVGMALFVVLAVLVALLAAPAWRGTHTEAAPARETASGGPAPASGGGSAIAGGAPRAARIAALPPRLAFALALFGFLLAGLLLFSLASRSAHPGDAKLPLTAARAEIDALAKLAQSSVAQGTELNRERDVRRRAEEDAQFKQGLLTQSLEEKIRLGHDLHDGIIQSLYAVGLTLESVRGLLRDDPAEADRRIEQCRAALNSSIREARGYITGLTPDNLRKTGFARALETLLSELGASRDASFEIEVDEEAAALLTPDQALEALQIAREAVSNALRHGRASVIVLRLHKGDREICLLVQDNGAGFAASDRRDGGHGLDNMHARAARIGATLRITSQPGEGARVVATVPLLENAAV